MEIDVYKIREASGLDQLILEVVEEIPSTNQSLIRRPFSVRPAPLILLIAKSQTSGRGRWGRSWVSEPGRSLTFSLSYERFSSGCSAVGALPIVVGIICASFLNEIAPGVLIKWPNDLMRKEGKIGGILVERSTHKRLESQELLDSDQTYFFEEAPASERIASMQAGCADIERLVIGVGINIFGLKEILVDQAVSSLFFGEKKINFFLEEIIGGLSGAIMRGVFRFFLDGLSAFYPDWVKFDIFFGKKIVVICSGEVTYKGTVCGLDKRGGLVLMTSSGSHYVVDRSDVVIKLI